MTMTMTIIITSIVAVFCAAIALITDAVLAWQAAVLAWFLLNCFLWSLVLKMRKMAYFGR